MEFFVNGSLVFPFYLISFGQGSYKDFDDTSFLFDMQVIHSDIDGSTCLVVGPSVMFIEGIVCRDNGRSEVFAELAFEYLDYGISF